MIINLSFLSTLVYINILTCLSYLSIHDDEPLLTKEELEEIYHSIDTYDDSPPTVLYFFKKTPTIYPQVLNKIPFPNYTCYDHEYITVNELDLNVKIATINDQIDLNSSSIRALVDINDNKDAIDLLILDPQIELLSITFYCSKRQNTNQTTFHVKVPTKEQTKLEHSVQIIYSDEITNDFLKRLKNISCQIWTDLSDGEKCTYNQIFHERLQFETSNISNIVHYSMKIDLNSINCFDTKTIENISNNIHDHLKRHNFMLVDLKIHPNQHCNNLRGEISLSKYVGPIVIVLIVVIMVSICCTGFLFHRRRKLNNNINSTSIFKPKKPAILIEEIEYNTNKKNTESTPLNYNTLDKDRPSDMLYLNNYKSTRDPPPYDI